MSPQNEDELLAQGLRRAWITAFGLFALLAISMGGNLVQALQSKLIPYVVATNAKGEPQGFIQALRGSQAEVDIDTRFQIDDFITKAFWITNNWQEQVDWGFLVRDMSAPETWTIISTFLKQPENDPRELMNQYWQEVWILTPAMRQPEPDTYRAEFELVRYSYHSAVVTRNKYWATMLIKHGEPMMPTNQNPFGNPLGIRISAFHMQLER